MFFKLPIRPNRQNKVPKLIQSIHSMIQIAKKVKLRVRVRFVFSDQLTVY